MTGLLSNLIQLCYGHTPPQWTKKPVRDAQPSATSCCALFLQEPTASQKCTALGYKLLHTLPAKTNSHDEHARHLAELQLQVARRATYYSPQPKVNTQGTWPNSGFKSQPRSQHGSPRQTQTIVELWGTRPNSSTSHKAALLEGTYVPQSTNSHNEDVRHLAKLQLQVARSPTYRAHNLRRRCKALGWTPTASRKAPLQGEPKD
jgi:hypothetical protein